MYVLLASYHVEWCGFFRAGLDDGTCALLARFPRIIYISCNPVTLARDVEKLKTTHSIHRAAAFDQFPYTHHLEAGVYLIRKAGATIAEETYSVEKIAAVIAPEDDDPASKKPKLQ